MAKRYMRRKAQNVDVTWYGDDFLEIIHKYGDEAWMVAGKHLLQAATARAPRGKTGNLRKSGYVSTNTQSTYVYRPYWRREQKAPANGVTVGFSAPHSHLLESGRRRSGRIRPRGDLRYQGTLRRTRRALKIGDRYVSRARFRRMSSRPFLGPAIEETRESIVVELSNVLRSRLEKILGVVRIG